MNNKRLNKLITSDLIDDVKIGYQLIMRKYKYSWIINWFIFKDIRIYTQKNIVNIYIFPPYKDNELRDSVKNIQFNTNNNQDDLIIWY